MSAYVIVFRILETVVRRWPRTASSPRRSAGWGYVLLPVVLIGIGVLILVEGGTFGL